mmetsp:Transcript_33808/g.80611  ORF Transcript_33808/g.80611 Transcript_33808/m.80611 type:complete len:144 (-) Transcript_33808:61-492(-)
MADAAPRKRSFRKYYYRGIEVHNLLDLSHREFMNLVTARARRKFQRGLKEKPLALIKRLRKAKKEAAGTGEKPAIVKTHLRNMIVVPEMVASQLGVYNGQGFVLVEVKPDMVGRYLGEFAITYKPVRHGRPGMTDNLARFVPV